MEVDNDTSTPVNYDQSGGGPTDPGLKAARAAGGASLAEENYGRLPGGGGSSTFTPVGEPPYVVTFYKMVSTTVEDPEAKVTLTADWTIKVT